MDVYARITVIVFCASLCFGGGHFVLRQSRTRGCVWVGRGDVEGVVVYEDELPSVKHDIDTRSPNAGYMARVWAVALKKAFNTNWIDRWESLVRQEDQTLGAHVERTKMLKR